MEKVLKCEGESGVMCCKLKEGGKVEQIFSICFCEKLNKSVSQKLGGFIDGKNLAGSLCNILPRTRHNFCWL